MSFRFRKQRFIKIYVLRLGKKLISKMILKKIYRPEMGVKGRGTPLNTRPCSSSSSCNVELDFSKLCVTWCFMHAVACVFSTYIIIFHEGNSWLVYGYCTLYLPHRCRRRLYLVIRAETIAKWAQNAGARWQGGCCCLHAVFSVKEIEMPSAVRLSAPMGGRRMEDQRVKTPG